MAALLRTAAALAPPPSSPLSAREPRGRCLLLACSRRAPVRPLRAWLLPTPHVFCRAGGRLRRLGATEADEAAQTATQVRVGVLVAVARVNFVVPLYPTDVASIVKSSCQILDIVSVLGKFEIENMNRR